MRRQVVVTRPRPEADELARAVEALGFSPMIAPMLVIESLDAALPALGGYGGLAFTSANGAEAFATISPERAMPAYAVGEATAATLAKHGFRDIRLADGDAEALARMIAASNPRLPILHASGRAVARDLSELLAPSGVPVDRVEVYDARAAAMPPAFLVDALRACTVAYVLFYSARTAITFGTLLRGAGLTEMLRPITAICLSPQVADAASALPWKAIDVAARPRTPDLLAALSRADQRSSQDYV